MDDKVKRPGRRKRSRRASGKPLQNPGRFILSRQRDGNLLPNPEWTQGDPEFYADLMNWTIDLWQALNRKIRRPNHVVIDCRKAYPAGAIPDEIIGLVERSYKAHVEPLLKGLSANPACWSVPDKDHYYGKCHVCVILLESLDEIEQFELVPPDEGGQYLPSAAEEPPPPSWRRREEARRGAAEYDLLRNNLLGERTAFRKKLQQYKALLIGKVKAEFGPGPHRTPTEKTRIADWISAELAALGLALVDPKGRPAVLKVDEDKEHAQGIFRLIPHGSTNASLSSAQIIDFLERVRVADASELVQPGSLRPKRTAKRFVSPPR